jgi:glycosyltransferase involved in cell wall biosynthesis
MKTAIRMQAPRKMHAHSLGVTMKVAVFTASVWRSACPLLRIQGPAKYCGLQVQPGNAGPKVFASVLAEADIVIIHRDFPRYQHAYQRVINVARQRSVPVIYESDDLLHEIPDDHPDRSYYQAAWFPIMQALVEADAITTSTPLLGECYRAINDKTFVLPNYIDPELWPVHRTVRPNDQRPVVIGYMGTHTHAPDIRAITPALSTLLNQNPGKTRLKIWGPPPSAALANRSDVQWQELGLVDYHQFADFFSRHGCDIFIAPLCDSPFNRCKSNLKFLEYSSLGVPGIYSRVVPYQDIVVHGDNGFLAGSPAEWQNCLTRLIHDPALRFQMGLRAQQTVRDHWLLPRHAARWGDLYHEVLAGKRQRNRDSSARRLVQQFGNHLHNVQQAAEHKDLIARLMLHSLHALQGR